MELQLTNAEKRAELSRIPGRLNDLQVKAIRLSAGTGRDIHQKFPEIAGEYRSGWTAPKLVAKYGFDIRYGINRRTAISAVRHALCGYSGWLTEPYEGLISERSEQEQLALAHNRQTGIEASIRKIGIHSLTREQKAEAGRKGGLIRGPLTYRLRIGVHAMPYEALCEHLRSIAPLGGKSGGVASVLAKGLIPYAAETADRISEKEFVLLLATDPRFLGPVRTNYEKLSEQVNKVFHFGKPHRTRITLKIALQSLRRHKHVSSIATADPDILFAERWSLDPIYQIPARIKAGKIALRVNEEYHGGRPVRNSLSIRGAIRHYRRHRKLKPADQQIENRQL
jgi:hypothetical protein